MNDENRKWTIVDLMGTYSILIPALQRNYVHGRDDVHAEEVRNHFVDGVLQCVTNHKGMHLDIVYGTVEERNRILVPIDGQQRLTTLWLIAVYCAQVSVKLADLRRVETLDTLSRFSYEARPLASTFCRWLTSSCKFGNLSAELNDAYRMWGEDPTVSALITTLRLIVDRIGIAKAVNDVADVVLRRVLRQRDRAVTFDFRPVPGDATDLYVKINARGKVLTQWENFKGKFSNCLAKNKDQKDRFDKEVEELSESYFKWSKERLPDDSFFALFGRVIEYWLLKNPSGNAQPVGAHLTVLATSNLNGKLPYVPEDEFQLGRSAVEVCDAVLRVIAWGLNHASAKFKYWESRTIAQALFTPATHDERDFSLVLFEYFLRRQDRREQEQLSDNEYRAIRLIANVLENVTRDNEKRFNRVEGLLNFLDNPDLYDTSCNESKFKGLALQYREELLKASVYRVRENRALLQEAEVLMHGRVRLAIGDLNDGNLSRNPDRFQARARTLIGILKQWNEEKSSRRRLLSKIILGTYWDVPAKIAIPVSLADDVCRKLLSNDLDGWLQKSLIDKVEKPESWYSAEKAGAYGFGKYARDWRENVSKFILGNLKLPGINLEEGDFLVRRHWNAYYLYVRTNNPGAYPVGDYRIEFYTNPKSNFRKAMEGLGVKDMRMNYTGKRFLSKAESKIKDVEFHFFSDSCKVEMVNERGVHSEVKSFLVERITGELGWSKFVRSIEEFAVGRKGRNAFDKWMRDSDWPKSLQNPGTAEQQMVSCIKDWSYALAYGRSYQYDETCIIVSEVSVNRAVMIFAINVEESRQLCLELYDVNRVVPLERDYSTLVKAFRDSFGEPEKSDKTWLCYHTKVIRDMSDLSEFLNVKVSSFMKEFRKATSTKVGTI